MKTKRPIRLLLMKAAALERENAKLRAALQDIVNDYEFCKSDVGGWGDRSEAYAKTATAALQEDNHAES